MTIQGTGVWAIVQARLGSVRLPRKILADICGLPMLQRVVERVLVSGLVEGVVVATPSSELEMIQQGVPQMPREVRWVGGSHEDVLDRYWQAAQEMKASIVVRVTADCPLLDAKTVDTVVNFLLVGEYEYVTNRPSFPDGFDCEAFTLGALRRAVAANSLTALDREHVTPYFRRGEFKAGTVYHDADLAWTPKLSIDTEEDLARVRMIYEAVGEHAGLADVIGWLEMQ